MQKVSGIKLFAALLIIVVSIGDGRAQPEQLLDGPNLIAALKQGGYNIYFRHAQTDWAQNDYINQAGDWNSCDPAQVRQLSTEGKQVARSIGAAIRALRIPVGKVFSSPYCRCVQTAEFFGVGPVTTTTDVMNLRVAEHFGGRDAIIKRAQKRLATDPATGTNNIFVAHGNVARESTPVYPGEAEAVVFRPDQKGGFFLVARITPSKWKQLAQQVGKQ